MTEEVERLATVVVDTAFGIHKELGPGLLESVYEVVLAKSLERKGYKVERQKPVSIEYDGLRFEEGFRVDLLVDDRLVIELKSTEKLTGLHRKQVLTYLRLLDSPLGLLINFGSEVFREGVKRVVNRHKFDFRAFGGYLAPALSALPPSMAVAPSRENIRSK